MSALKIFISSTCYDMAILRSELRSYLLEIGHDPLVSENSDILFDPRQHTHANCIQEIASCDYVMVFIGSRFGEPLYLVQSILLIGKN